VVKKRQRVRHQDRRAGTLSRPCRDQDCRRWRQGAGERSGREYGEAGYKDSFGTHAVAQGAAGQDQRGEGNCVDTDHPLQFGYAAAERSPDAAQGSVDDGDIQLDHTKAEAHRRERQGFDRFGTRIIRVARSADATDAFEVRIGDQALHVKIAVRGDVSGSR
jgi:hypothetical protein